MIKYFILGFLILAPAFADQNKSQTVICVHPDDEKMGHKITPESCRPVAGHSGIFKSDQTVIDVCAECQAQHSANPDQCKVTPFSCTKKRPVAE